MKKYIINYSYPANYKGTYLVEGKDGMEASEKLRKHLEKERGAEKDSTSTVMEVYDNNIILV